MGLWGGSLCHCANGCVRSAWSSPASSCGKNARFAIFFRLLDCPIAIIIQKKVKFCQMFSRKMWPSIVKFRMNRIRCTGEVTSRHKPEVLRRTRPDATCIMLQFQSEMVLFMDFCCVLCPQYDITPITFRMYFPGFKRHLG